MSKKPITRSLELTLIALDGEVNGIIEVLAFTWKCFNNINVYDLCLEKMQTNIEKTVYR